jgi:hypothetical protein
MSKKARSARGELVDFDMLAIKQQLATLPVPVSVDARRRFIDDKDGVKQKATKQAPVSPEIDQLNGPLSMAFQAAQESAGEDDVYQKD